MDARLLKCYWLHEADEHRNTNLQYKVIDKNEERGYQTALFRNKEVPLFVTGFRKCAPCCCKC